MNTPTTPPTLGDAIDALYDAIRPAQDLAYRHSYPTPEGALLTTQSLKAIRSLLSALSSSDGTRRADALDTALQAVGVAIRANAALAAREDGA